MATSKFYLDDRRSKGNIPAPLKIAIRNNNSTAYISTDIYLTKSQWDNVNGRVKNNHPSYKSLNSRLSHLKGDVDLELISLKERSNSKKLSATEIKKIIQAKLYPSTADDENVLFKDAFNEFMALKKNNTRGVYMQTYIKICKFTDIDSLQFSDITPRWLTKFDNFLALTAPSKNARNIHLRNIRAVFNYAIENEYTLYYPFRRHKIRPEATRKRSLSIKDLRELFNYPVEPYAKIYQDMFKLIFLLIGINVVDLYNLKAIANGRIEYRRAKTHKLYSIKLEPEALEIIKAYKGTKNLLCLSDRWSDYRNFRSQINKALKSIGKEKNKGGRLKGGIPKYTLEPTEGRWPEITTYWARHTWATIAAELDIPDAVISQALGHSTTNTTTEIYIKRNEKKVDEANRKVLDYVFYNKK